MGMGGGNCNSRSVEGSVGVVGKEEGRKNVKRKLVLQQCMGMNMQGGRGRGEGDGQHRVVGVVVVVWEGGSTTNEEKETGRYELGKRG